MFQNRTALDLGRVPRTKAVFVLRGNWFKIIIDIHRWKRE